MTSILNTAATLAFTADEPWPADVQLFMPYEYQQVLMEEYARCLSLQTYMRMCSLSYETDYRLNAEYMSPSGKVPFIKAGRLIVSEFDPIVNFIKAKGFNLNKHLKPDDLADMKAYITLAESVLANAELYLTFVDEIVWNEVTKTRCGSSFSWPLSVIIPRMKRQQYWKILKANGWAIKTRHQIWEAVKGCCSTLSEKLGEQEYFFGDKPTELDAIVYAHLYTIITTKLPFEEFGIIIQGFKNLKNFVRRIDANYFSDREFK